MQAGKRKIKPGYEYDHLFPKCSMVDTVIQPEGKAKLHHTINLIKEMVATTLDDTAKVAPKLKGSNVRDTCRNVWQFVYDHIQYKLDKKGIEQVRRPSRVWAERKTGCDCDCMTVMICSLLTNLNIEHKIRITKYPVKSNPWLVPRYQHIYTVVTEELPIIMDTVTSWFDYEVPYLEKKDFTMNDGILVGTIEGVPSGFSGVDSLALREVIKTRINKHRSKSKHHPTYRVKPVSPVNVNIMVGRQMPCLQNQVTHQVPSEVKRIPEPLLVAPITSRNIQTKNTQQATTASQNPVHARSNTTLKKGKVWTKVLIAGVAGIGTYQIIKILT
ncbi:hypothetical protein JMN32_05375 [Fulvivirga sp. 29W222]|uniref:Uncharacterized protein n=1 Tax=Fulvivirga marina TaxID=2494733 RepID=A0A937KBB8_9BACT|nr:hypothetical protein [Fulvivirga marina]MBL6445729.1 hypothetical protein [Fulvivirga marina]